MSKFEFKKLVNMLAYVAVVIVGVTLVLSGLMPKFSNMLNDFAYYILLFVVAVTSFAYAKSKRNIAYLVVWVVAVALIVVSYVI